MSQKILLLNGPNLNLLGMREPDIYGAQTLSDIEAHCANLAKDLGFALEVRQSNWEGQLVDWVQEARMIYAGIVINPGAYSHSSIALLDALNAFEGPVLEVHLSNIHRREAFRHHSYISQRADGIVIGCGAFGYEMALRDMVRRLSARS